MIKFFRQIRRKLLTENKLRKYLLYAIGEIILVVIGILIALSINNWNSKRIANTKMKSFLQNIKEDLVIDTVAFSGRIKIYGNFLGLKKKMLSLAQFENTSTDSLFLAIKPRYFPYELNTTSITKITNLGITELSKNDNLSRKIYNYYTTELKLFNTFINWDIECTNTESHYWLFSQKEFEMNYKNEFPLFLDKNISRENLIKIYSEPKGRNYMQKSYYRKKLVLENYIKMKKLANELIIGIDNEFIDN